jgi:tyrosine aminotransferase
MSEIKASKVSLRTRNPIRAIVDSLKVQPHPDKEFISLALGDPTTFGNFKLDASYCFLSFYFTQTYTY